MRYESVQLKQLKDVAKPGDKKPNWWFLVNDKDNTDIKGYSNQDLQSIQQALVTNPQHTFVNIAGDDYPPEPNRLKRAVFTLVNGDDVPKGQEKPDNKEVVGQTTEPKPILVSGGLSKGEEMLITGIWTRGVTSNKSANDLEAYADRALQYIRKQIGGDDEPFNDQF